MQLNKAKCLKKKTSCFLQKLFFFKKKYLAQKKETVVDVIDSLLLVKSTQIWCVNVQKGAFISSFFFNFRLS